MSKVIFKDRVDFFIIRPRRGRRSYSIVRRTTPWSGGKPRNEVVTHPVLENVNKRVQARAQTVEEAERQLKGLLRALREAEGLARPEIAANPRNMAYLDEVWHKRFEYKTSYANENSKRSGYNSFRRAIEAIGELDLLAASDQAIEKRVMERFSCKRKQIRILSDLGTLSKHLGVERHFSDIRRPRDIVRYLTLPELLEVCKGMPREFRLFYLALFFTGCRKGEAEALGPDSFDGKYISVQEQVRFDRKRAEPKWGSVRDAFVPDEGRLIVRKWCELPPALKRQVRESDHRDTLGSACKRVFPDNPKKHCTPHDLRHSYAKHLKISGIPMDLIAEFLGNEPVTCARYYAGIITTKDSLEAAEAMYRRSRKPVT